MRINLVNCLHLIYLFYLTPLLCPFFNEIYCNSDSSSYLFTKTRSSFYVESNSVVAAYADINRDRKTDIISVSADGMKIFVNFMKEKMTVANDGIKSITEVKTSLTLSNIDGIKVTGVIPCDFDGDSLVDFIILTQAKGKSLNDVITAFILYEVVNHFDSTFVKLLKLDTFVTQPLLLDYNADMIADFMGYTSSENKTYVYKGGKPFERIEIKGITREWYNPGYSGFFDGLNVDNPGILLTLKSLTSEIAEFHFFPKTGDAFNFEQPIVIPLVGVKVLGAPLFRDWEFKNRLSILIPYCGDDACTKSGLKLIPNVQSKEVHEINVDMMGYQWILTAYDDTLKRSPLQYGSLLPLRASDLFHEHFPDAVGVVADKNKERHVVIIRKSKSDLAMFLRKMDGFYGNVLDVSVFDFHEDGIPDLLTIETSTLSTSLVASMLYEHGDGDRSFSSDTYFLKVMVLNGLCQKANCPNGILPYGLPIPGITISYKTESTHGDDWQAKAGIMTSSSYVSSQLPFHIFGLGDFANYIEHLFIALPKIINNPNNRFREFTFIVPKTQVVVIPYPIDKPSKWKNQLYLEPFKDRKVIYVAITLLGTCFLVLIIICLLQYMEYREDKYERAQEVSAFNFDAM